MNSSRNILKDLLVRWGLLKTKLSEEDFKQVLEASTISGAIDKAEHELIKSILEFTDTTVKEIMVPRPDIVALDISMPREVLVRKVIDEGYSRLPVYRDNIDHIIGIIYSKDLLSLLEHRDLILLQDIIRPVFFVPESKKISQLLREFQQRKAHLAIVTDENGGTEGLVTMEDIVEEIVGEIHDEYDEVGKVTEPAKDGSVIVDARLSVSDINRQFAFELPESPEYETLAGLIQKVLGRLPEMGESTTIKDLHFTILSKTARRIRQVRIERLTSGSSSGVPKA
ncbi:MAG: hemolysin family protein [Ignavibacteriales bacterium]|nr:hemolysin family protein [Ignavibacteriales bacterium]